MSFVPLKDILSQVAPAPTKERPTTTNEMVVLGDNKVLAKKDKPFFDIFAQVLREDLGSIVAPQIHPLFFRNGVICALSFHRASADILRLKEKEITARMNMGLQVATVRGIRILS